jgi:hypothetical protein
MSGVAIVAGARRVGGRTTSSSAGIRSHRHRPEPEDMLPTLRAVCQRPL